MRTCEGKLKYGTPCPETVKNGRKFCRWHDPKDKSWHKLYQRLEKVSATEKTNIVLRLIEKHPEHILSLPERDGLVADLTGIDISNETIKKLRSKIQKVPSWWHPTLEGINLADADLRGAKMDFANLKGANLSYAQLQRTVASYANLDKTFLTNADFQNAKLYNTSFQGAKLDATNFSEAYLGSANFEEAHFTNTYFDNAHLESAKLKDVDLSDVSLKNIFISGAWLNKTRIQQKKLGKAIGEELEHEFANAKRGYLALKQNFDDLGDYAAASWAYCRERRMEKAEAWETARAAYREQKWRDAITNYFKFATDLIVEWLCDYGESVWRVVGWMTVLLFVVGPILFSGLGGIVWTKELSREYLALSGLPKFLLWYRIYLLYTLDTLTTASFSGLQPINDAVKLGSGFFAIAGIVLAGLLGFVAGNRIRRS